MPALHSLNASARSHTDFVAVLDPRTGASTRLALAGLADARGLSVHGMDVVPSAADPAELFVYLVNHRPAADGTATDPSVEVFRTIHGGRVLEHVRTYADAGVMRSPNDVVGAPDGQSFWFTNDGSHLRGFAVRPRPSPRMRVLFPLTLPPLSSSRSQHAAQIYLGTARGSIGFCSAAGGCRFAAEKIQGANGLARVSDDVFFLGNALRGELRVLERQADDSLVVTDLIKHGASTPFPPSHFPLLTFIRGAGIDMPVDNLSVDKDGAVWAAGEIALFTPPTALAAEHVPVSRIPGFPKGLDLMRKHFPNPSLPAATTAIRITLNTGRSAFFGEKYKLEKVRGGIPYKATPLTCTSRTGVRERRNGGGVGHDDRGPRRGAGQADHEWSVCG